jgi:excisionase family DNA binding protein
VSASTNGAIGGHEAPPAPRKVKRKVPLGAALVAAGKAAGWHSTPALPVMTTAEVAAFFRVSTRQVWRMVEAGALRPAYPGGIRRPRFDRAEVEAAWRRALEDRP